MLKQKLSVFNTLPNQITAVRLLLLPLLWILTLLNEPRYLGLGFLAAAGTDFLDGYIARWQRKTTRFGSQFDSIADACLFGSALFWLIILNGAELWANVLWLSGAVGVNILALLTGWLKFGRFGNLHLFSNKIAAVTVFLFILYTFLFSFNPRLYDISLVIYFLSSLESLLVLLLCSNVHEHMGSILFHLRQAK